jgi:hypothetical protein
MVRWSTIAGISKGGESNDNGLHLCDLGLQKAKSKSMEEDVRERAGAGERKPSLKYSKTLINSTPLSSSGH